MTAGQIEASTMNRILPKTAMRLVPHQSLSETYLASSLNAAGSILWRLKRR